MAADATRAVPAAQQKNDDVSFISSFLEGQKGNVRSLAEWLDLRAARIREPRGARLRGLVTPQELHPSPDDVAPEALERVADWLREHGQASHEYLARVPRARDISSLQDFVDWATHAAGQGIASSVPTLAAATLAAPLGVPAMAAAGLVPSIIQNTGALAEQLKSEGQDPAVADVLGLPLAALDVITPTRLASKLVGGTTGKLATRVLKGAAESMLTEGATEGGQTFLEEATVSRAKRKPVLTRENLIRSLEGAAAGTVPGAILGGASGIRAEQPKAAAQQPEPSRSFPEWLAQRTEPLRRKAAEVIAPEVEQERRSAERAAETDALTGLANRAALDRALPAAEADAATSVIAFDANNFGAVNKKLGHESGDKVLARLARAVQQAAQEAGVGERVFRRGGDEFVVLAPKEMADRIRARAEEIAGVSEIAGGESTPVSLSGTVGNTFAEADAQLQARKAERKAPKPREEDGPDVQQVGSTQPSAPAAVTREETTPNVQPVGNDVAYADPRSVKVDPERFQYKLDVDESGVGRELKSVRKYDPNLAGVVQVWRDPADGQTYVVNGHHRHDLAVRTGQPRELVRYIEAKTAAEARIIGARTNIAEGRGTAIDAGKLFREQRIDAASLDEMGISRTGAIARDGLALSSLPQALFQQVVSGHIPVARGAVIGGSGLDETQQLALAQMLREKEKGGRRLTNDAVSELIRFVRGAGETQVTQDSLFGEETLQQSNAIEKAELSAHIKKRLSQDRKLFGFLTRGGRAGRIQESGVGEIQTERATEIADAASQMEEVYNRLSTLSGPVSKALNDAAAQLARGGDANAVRSQLYDAVRAAVTNELTALTGSREASPGAGEEASARPAASRPPAGSTASSGRVGFPEIQDDILGGPPKVSGDPQSELFAPESPETLAVTERRARRTIERLRPLIGAGKATEEQKLQYREALALTRRDKKQSAEEVQLRAEGEAQPADTRDMFGEIAGSPNDVASSNPAFQESLPTAARSVPPPDPLMPATANLPSQISRALSGSLATPANPLDPTSAPEVIEALGKVLEAVGRAMPMRVGLQRVRNARGYFRIKEEVIRLQQANDIPTAAHELGHALEKALYGWPKQGPWKKPLISTAMSRELATLGKKLYGNTKPVGGYKREGFAEFMRIWLTESDHSGNPDHVDHAAPQFTQWFESEFLGKLPEVKKAMEEARDQALRWRTQGAATRAKQSIIDPAGPGERLKAGAEAAKNVDLYRLFVESASALEELSRAAAEKLHGPLDPAEDPFYTTAALRLTHTARARYMVEEHMIDLAGNPVGKPLKDIRALVEGRKDDFMIYLWARRALVLWNSGRNPGLSIPDAQQIVKELGTPKFQLAASKVYEWNAGVLNYAAQASPTFQLVVDRIRADEKKNGPRDYIPLMREFDQLDKMWGGASRVATKNSPVKRLKGSGRRIKDPFQSMITQAEQTILAAHKRKILDQIFRLNRIEGFGGFLEEVPAAQKKVAQATINELLDKINQTLFAKGPPGTPLAQVGQEGDTVSSELLNEMIAFFAPAPPSDGENPVVPFYDQGRVRYFVVPRDLYRSLAGLDLYRLPRAVDLVLGVPARAARAGTTGLRASFGLVTNPLRDIQTLYVNTRAKGNGLQLLHAWLQGLRDAALYRTAGKKTEWVDAFVRLGGEMAQPLGQDIPHTRRAARRLFAGRKQQLLDPRNWYDGFRDLVQFPESAPRTAELKLVAEEIGWKPGTPMSFSQSLRLLTALKQVTTDFTAAGEISRVMNQIVPFHNAAIQGPRASLRALKRNPGKFAWRGAQMTALTLMLWWLHKDEEWWQEMDARERATYWHFPVGDDLLVRIPRSFEIGQFFSALPEALADAAYRADPEAMTEWFTTTFQVSKPPVLPVPVSEALEQAANKDMYFGRPIVTQANQRKPAEEQFNEYTTRVAIALGRIFNQSPQRIDHAISSAFGPVGGDVLSVLGLGAKEIPREKEASDLPVVGRLFARGGQAGTRPRSVDKLYQALDKAEQRQHSDRRQETEAQRQQRLQLSDAAQAVSALIYVRQYTPENEKRRELTREMLRLAADAVERNERGSVVRDRFAGARETAQDRKEGVRARVESARVARQRLPRGKEPAAAQPR